MAVMEANDRASTSDDGGPQRNVDEPRRDRTAMRWFVGIAAIGALVTAFGLWMSFMSDLSDDPSAADFELSISAPYALAVITLVAAVVIYLRNELKNQDYRAMDGDSGELSSAIRLQLVTVGGGVVAVVVGLVAFLRDAPDVTRFEAVIAVLLGFGVAYLAAEVATEIPESSIEEHARARDHRRLGELVRARDAWLRHYRIAAGQGRSRAALSMLKAIAVSCAPGLAVSAGFVGCARPFADSASLGWGDCLILLGTLVVIAGANVSVIAYALRCSVDADVAGLVFCTLLGALILLFAGSCGATALIALPAWASTALVAGMISTSALSVLAMRWLMSAKAGFLRRICVPTGLGSYFAAFAELRSTRLRERLKAEGRTDQHGSRWSTSRLRAQLREFSGRVCTGADSGRSAVPDAAAEDLEQSGGGSVPNLAPKN